MRRKILFSFALCGMLAAQTGSFSIQTKLSTYETLRKTNVIASLEPDEDQYVRTNLSREDIWGTLTDFERRREVRFDASASVKVCADYLVAEHYQLTRNSEITSVQLHLRGQKALAKYLDEIASKEEVASVSAFLAEELGKGALTVPRRNRYGAVQLDSVPRGADVTVDDSKDVTATTLAKFILITGHHQLFCQKTGFDTATVPIDVISGKPATATCALKKTTKH